MERKTFFVDVILPLPIKGTFTYRVPAELNDEVGLWQRVVIQFGRKKVYTAIVVNIHEIAPTRYTVKYILSVIDPKPVINAIQFEFWKWIAEYYMSEVGAVMNVAIPSALKLASESTVVPNPEFDGDFDSLPEKEYLIAEALDIQKKLSLTEIERIISQKKVIPVIKGMLEKNLILLEEEIKEKYKPRHETMLRLSKEYRDESKLQELFASLEKKAFRQLEVLMAYLSQSGFDGENEKPVNKSFLVNKVEKSNGAIQSLVKKEVFEQYSVISSRLVHQKASKSPEDIILSPDQQTAYRQIKESFEQKRVVLLHGVTSAGKTEIYIHLIEEVIQTGKQVLYLLPEIALTTQIISRLQKYFGEKVGVYHSKYNENERMEIWNQVLNYDGKSSKYQIILGPRSALFLPFQQLGLIIVDEEHDYSYKQFDPAPRYNARDGAIYLSTLHQCKVLLGTATPSLETYFNAKTGKYGLVELNQRYGDVQLPEILVADLKKETRYRTMKSHFSSLLLKHIDEALKSGEQIILFQNRRGYSLRLECDTCHWMPECKNCDVTLIYHKHSNQLKCHYCGYSRSVPGRCDSCGSTHIKMKGFGTEKLEDELAIFYPEATIKRMDLDTTRSKYAYQNIIHDFENRGIDILVGTQMVTKGLDFDNVSVVGVMSADNMISFPDFRAYERSYQMMAQVSGRAGRQSKQGKVIIQSFNPYHQVIRDVIAHDYQSMYQSQILERRNFKYPPFYKLIALTLKHKDSRVLNDGARELARLLREKLGERILGPEYPLISKIKNLYLKNILIKLERDEVLSQRKQDVLSTLETYKSGSSFRNIWIQINVDPI